MFAKCLFERAPTRNIHRKGTTTSFIIPFNHCIFHDLRKPSYTQLRSFLEIAFSGTLTSMPVVPVIAFSDVRIGGLQFGRARRQYSDPLNSKRCTDQHVPRYNGGWRDIRSARAHRLAAEGCEPTFVYSK